MTRQRGRSRQDARPKVRQAKAAAPARGARSGRRPARRRSWAGTWRALRLPLAIGAVAALAAIFAWWPSGRDEPAGLQQAGKVAPSPIGGERSRSLAPVEPPATAGAPPAREPPSSRPDPAASTPPAATVVALPPTPEAAVPAPPARDPVVEAPQAMLAIIIDDLGPDRGALDQLLALPGPLTLSFLPYADDVGRAVTRAREAGHEPFLHLGMAPEGPADPGPQALTAGLDRQDLERRTRWAIGRMPGIVGVNNHMGSLLTARAEPMAVVMTEIARAGLLFVDSRTTARSVAERTARELGVPTTGRDVFLDNRAEGEAIARELDRAVGIARERGSAVAIGHPYSATIEALRRFLPSLPGRGVRLVPASAVVAARGCGEAQGGREACQARVARIARDAAG